jgi:hypothetical protein
MRPDCAFREVSSRKKTESRWYDNINSRTGLGVEKLFRQIKDPQLKDKRGT